MGGVLLLYSRGRMSHRLVVLVVELLDLAVERVDRVLFFVALERLLHRRFRFLLFVIVHK